MDDNKVLTLASNERIPLHSHMRLIFEIREDGDGMEMGFCVLCFLLSGFV